MSREDFLQCASWVHRIGEMFKLLDVDKDGYVTREDYQVTLKRMEDEAKPDPKLLAIYRDCVEESCVALGLTQGKRFTKEEFLKAAATFSEGELARKKRGEKILLDKVQHAFYDVIDTNHDGFVRLDEYKLAMKINGLDHEMAEAAFKVIDKNQNGKIERQELIEQQLNFWCTIDHKESQGMLGERFEP